MRYKAYTLRNYSEIPQIKKLKPEQRKSIEVVSRVLPFKTNNYVVNKLINWEHFEEDPIFILNFPQKGMLSDYNYNQLYSMINNEDPEEEIARFISRIRNRMNPHPAGQLEHNVPTLNGEKIQGIQHKYRETALFFPSQGQTCHAYCTFCFRWPQFTGMSEIKFAMKQSKLLTEYLKKNTEITDVLITGGDPMTMKTKILARYINAILDGDLPQIRTIRIGTKSLSFWPYRFLTDSDSEELLQLFKRVSDKGIHLALMAHFNHYKEFETAEAHEAIYKIRQTGAEIRTQSPILNHINNSAEVLSKMWRKQVDLGMIPYYMFMARNTGAQAYFGVDMQEALEVYQEAYKQVSGICRTVRGPSMSAGPGKIHVSGTAEINGEKVYVLNFIQGRDPDWVGKPFFAKYNPKAMWLDDLQPAFGASEFFYQKAYDKLLKINKLPEPKISRDGLQSA